MQTILVTGANKGIGLATVRAVLEEQTTYRVLLGSRDAQRGQEALQLLLGENPAWEERLRTIKLDVASDKSVEAVRQVIIGEIEHGSMELYGLVNNAGRGNGPVHNVLDVNLYGIRRICDALIPALIDGGRVVNVTSAAGPNFVARCDRRQRRILMDNGLTWDRLEKFAIENAAAGSPYGLSKACANTYTTMLAERFPHLSINACTPGFVETDLGKEFLGARTPAMAGMKSPEQGCRVIMSLLFDADRGSGYYFGSDARRSPMHRYRAPGTKEYSG